MRISLNVEVDTRSRAARIALAAVASVVVLLAGAAVVRASVPNTFKAGDVLSSSAVNENFSAVSMSTYSGSAGTKYYSAGATKYCGVTTTSVNGSLGGYPGAKQQCEATCTSATAHMCLGDELVRSASLGLSVPGGWYSAGASATVTSTGNLFIRDCQNWSSTSSSEAANVWPASFDVCSASHPLLCCD
jgi:hypothetical protein